MSLSLLNSLKSAKRSKNFIAIISRHLFLISFLSLCFSHLLPPLSFPSLHLFLSLSHFLHVFLPPSPLSLPPISLPTIHSLFLCLPFFSMDNKPLLNHQAPFNQQTTSGNATNPLRNADPATRQNLAYQADINDALSVRHYSNADPATRENLAYQADIYDVRQSNNADPATTQSLAYQADINDARQSNNADPAITQNLANQADINDTSYVYTYIT